MLFSVAAAIFIIESFSTVGAARIDGYQILSRTLPKNVQLIMHGAMDFSGTFAYRIECSSTTVCCNPTIIYIFDNNNPFFDKRLRTQTS